MTTAAVENGNAEAAWNVIEEAVSPENVAEITRKMVHFLQENLFWKKMSVLQKVDSFIYIESSWKTESVI